MLCESCGKNQATFFYKQTKNGYSVEKNLCSECAKKQGLGMSGNLFDFGGLGGFAGDDFFGGLLGSFAASSNEPKIVASETCPGCGMTLAELLHGGRVGCSQCYSVFRKSLMPTIIKIHGNVAHCGKIPKLYNQSPEELAEEEPKFASDISNSAEKTDESAGAGTSELDILKRKLREAIDSQEYENAAKYRDEIKALENKSKRENESGENKGKNENEREGDDAE